MKMKDFIKNQPEFVKVEITISEMAINANEVIKEVEFVDLQETPIKK